jgi:hypothetical protein
MVTTFIKVEYDLMSSTKLHSTQKLFIAYLIGWQRNALTCKETNNTLAKKFGLTYGGIRSLIKKLNKFDFFQAIAFDYDESNSTSGHEITVDETKLNDFLIGVKSSKKNQEVKDSIEIKMKHNIIVTDNNSSMDNVESDVPNIIDDDEDKYDLELESENDIVHNTRLIGEYYKKYGNPKDYIKAKVIFKDEDEFFIHEVFELKDIINRRKYVDKVTFEMVIKDFIPEGTEE